MNEQQAEYMLALLEEIRLINTAQLRVLARFRDDYCGYTDKDERTYKTADKEIQHSLDRLNVYHETSEKQANDR